MNAMVSLEDLIVSTAASVRPPERLTVAQSAAKYRKLNNVGAYVGPWRNETTPYLVEPMEILTSLDFTGGIFVGPAQSGKTEIYLNWHGHTVICDPTDLMLIEASQTRASDFSKRRIDRLHQHSPEIRSRMMPGKNFDNTFDKRYASGAMVTLSWPTPNELSGKPIPRLFLTDYDRMDDDVGGDGTPFDLAKTRATTFRRFGMTFAESSPSRPILDPRHQPATPHEAPPTGGILALYNRGDRRRWYWTCVNCAYSFEPDFTLMQWGENGDLHERSMDASLECPRCHVKYRDDRLLYQGEFANFPTKDDMNLSGTWLKDGEKLTEDGEVIGTGARSDIASFWLKGPAAAFKPWQTIVFNWLAANQEFSNSGIETSLKTTTNVDQALPYLPKSQESDRLPEDLKSRAKPLGEKVVPPQVRFLSATVDVQKYRFVAQVHGIAEGGEIFVIDRFDVKYSRREDPDKPGQMQRIRPFSYEEDWRILLSEVMSKTYPLDDDTGRHMRIKLTVCDSGGEDEGTQNSYNFFRWLREGPQETDHDSEDWPEWTPDMRGRFSLYKGRASPTAPRTVISYPDSKRKDRAAGARGEIPVLMVNVTPIKNFLDGMLDRDGKTRSKLHFADWLDINFYKELCVETKDHKGVWQNPKRFRNETWDLLVMQIAAMAERQLLATEVMDWSNPLEWAGPWDDNPLVFHPDDRVEHFAKERRMSYGIGDLAKKLG